MEKNILVISTSLRKGSNSELLADQFANGAKEAGHHVDKIGEIKGHPALEKAYQAGREA